MTPHQLPALLKRVADGDLTPEAALSDLRLFSTEDLGFACVDHHRELRQGAPEVIYAEHKTPEETVLIAETLLARGSNLLCTRTPEATALALQNNFPKGEYFPRARIFRQILSPPPPLGPVGVLCAGTSDLPVATEAARTLEFYGMEPVKFVDVGVAGLHRLLGRHRELERCRAHIVVAGMEGALASVVGGLVGTPVIAVPTSIGYGAGFGGLSALLAMLTCCAAGVTVVNIDNGFGAAAAVRRMLGSSELQAPPD